MPFPTIVELKEWITRNCFSCFMVPQEPAHESNIDVDVKKKDIPLPIPPPPPYPYPYPTRIVDDYNPEERDSVSQEAAEFYDITENDASSSSEE